MGSRKGLGDTGADFGFGERGCVLYKSSIFAPYFRTAAPTARRYLLIILLGDLKSLFINGVLAKPMLLFFVIN